MAPVPVHPDLLDAALKNKSSLPSWKSIFVRLTSPSPPSHETLSSISSFLAAPSSITVLSNCCDPFPAPSESSRQEYEKRTAAINFTAADQPPENGFSDAAKLPGIAVLKSEASELSKKLQIDEVSALRIVVLDHQNRPTKALALAKAGAGDEEAALFAGFGESMFRQPTKLDDSEKAEETFLERVAIYRSERRYIMKTAAFLLRKAMGSGVWTDVGKRFLQEGVLERHGGILERLVDTIKKRWVEAGDAEQFAPSWVKERRSSGNMPTYFWEKQNLLEIIHLLQILFLAAYRPVEQVNGGIVKKWYEFMAQTNFLTVTSRGVGDLDNLYNYARHLSSIVSVTLLEIPKVLRYLQEEVERLQTPDSSATPPTFPPSPPRGEQVASETELYVRSASAVKAITDCLSKNAKNTNLDVAGPAAMGWVIVLDMLRTFVHINSDFSDEASALSRRAPIVEFFEEVIHSLFRETQTTVEIGIKQIASVYALPMLELVTLLLETSTGASTSNGIGFWLGSEEDGLRMKNVFALVVRKAQTYMNLSVPLVSGAFITNDVRYEDLSVFEKFLEEEQTIAQDDASSWFGSPAANFLGDQDALSLLNRAKSRFPHEPLPFLKILRGLATEGENVTKFLTELNTYTEVLPYGFTALENVDEEAEPQIFNLRDHLLLFPPREDAYGSEGEGAIVIPAGSEGVQISASGSPCVIAWKYNYNALPLFGRILERALTDSPGATVGDQLTGTENVIEIVALLSLLISTKKQDPSSLLASASPVAYQVLEDASDMLGRNRDIISVVFDLIDAAMSLARTQQSSSPGDTTVEFAATGLQFVHSLIRVLPDRVWPWLARGSLIDRQLTGGSWWDILSSVEVVQGNYDFTLACFSLFEDLVEEAIRGTVRAHGHSKALMLQSKVQVSDRGAGLGVSSAMQRDILLSFTQCAIDIFESFGDWKYADVRQKLEIRTRCARIFTRILDLVYGFDESSLPGAKITGVLAASAERLVSVFLGAGNSELPLQPILRAIEDGTLTPESSLYTKAVEAWVESVSKALWWADKLVRVRDLLGLPPSHLEVQLFKTCSNISKLCSAGDRYKKPVLSLLTGVAKAAGMQSEEPPSILGHLGAETANHFVAVLSNLDRPYDDMEAESLIWEFVTTMFSNKQQGMSILLLRGETLRKGDVTAQDARKRSMLSICLDSLEIISALPGEKSLIMLQTIVTALDHWSLAMEDLGKHPRFLQAITNHIDSMRIEPLPSDTTHILTEKCYTYASAACIAQVLALYLHSRRPSARDGGFFKGLIPKLNFFFEKAVKISDYNASLHSNLQKNFEDKWPGIKLQQLKRSRLCRKTFGTEASYDLDLGGLVLSHDVSWSRSKGYRSEIEMANVNLSLVQSQVDLLAAWQLLSIELCDFVPTTPELAVSLVGVVKSCLKENMESGLPEPIFDHVLCQRAEFAFFLVRRLQQALPGASWETLVDDIFQLAWKCVSSSIQEFRNALRAASMNYYRPILRIVLITLKAQTSKPKHPTESLYTVLEILSLVVAKGFPDLAQGAHSHPDSANPQDIALVTAILQTCLQLNGIEEIYSVFNTHLIENNTVTAATTLYSWADQLAVDDDPVYGELSALFLLELSSVITIAEQLAIENVLERLTSCTLSQRISMGVSITSEPRLHAIWSRGLLPLALSLLASFETRLGRELGAFLKFFSRQLERAAASWIKPEIVTLPAVNEIATIALLMTIVKKLGGLRELEGLKWDTASLGESMEYLLNHRNYLRTLVVPTCVEEEEMGRREVEEGTELVERVVTGMERVREVLNGEEAEE